MAAVQAGDVRASFLFVDDLNGHHYQWLGSTTTNRHGAAFDIATVSGWHQTVVSPTHAHCGTLDLVMTDVHQSEKYLWCSAGFDCNYVRHYARHESRCFLFDNYVSLWK